MTRDVAVVANCHCLPLADTLALCCPSLKTDFIDVNFAALPEMMVKIEALDRDQPLVFTQPISAAHGALATEALRSRLPQGAVTTFTNIHFSGLHPDITYLGGMGERVPSLLGDYHSKLILFAYATRRTRADCAQLFAGATYEAIGFTQAFEQSSAELRQRDGMCDIRFAERFLAMVREEFCLYTMNHPTASVFLRLSSAIATHAGIAFRALPLQYCTNHLASSFIWPIYDEIAENSGLKYRTPAYFITSSGRSSRSYDLTEFIDGCYEIYARANQAPLLTAITGAPFFEPFATQLGI